MDPAVAHELNPALPGHGPWAPGEHCLTEAPTDKWALVQGQISSGEVPAHQLSDKICLDALDKVGETV